MQGTVTKKYNKWYYSYYDGKKPNGKYNLKWSSGFATKKQAQAALREKVAEVESSFVHSGERCSVKSYLEYWLDNSARQLARNTYNGYKVNIEKHIVPYIGDIMLDKLSPNDVDNLYNKLRDKGLSETSIHYVHAVLRRALNVAVKRRVIPYNVITYIEAPRSDDFKAQILNSSQMKTLIEGAKGTEGYIPILLAVTLGLRRGEALGVKWDDIDTEYKTINIQRTITFYKDEYVLSDCKTQKSKRTLLLTDFVLSELEEWKKEQAEKGKILGSMFNKENFVCCRIDGTPLSSSLLQKRFKKVLKDTGLPDIRFHDLRHSNATLLLKNHLPAKIASEMLGHSNISTTLDIYSHVQTEMQKEAVNIVNGIFNK